MVQRFVGVLCFVAGALAGVCLTNLCRPSGISDGINSEASSPSRSRKLKRTKSGMGTHTVEFCVSDIESAKAAVYGGATSLELCANRQEGGTSPSLGFVEEVVKLCRNISTEVHVLVRPRPGGFVYTQEEFEVILRDISAFATAGVDGIVCGILTMDNKVDEVRLRTIRMMIPNLKLTFHRAYDLCACNGEEAIHAIVTAHCDRLLTSGQRGSAICGKENLKILQDKYGSIIHIVAAAGIKASNVNELIRYTGIQGVHTGSGVDTDHFETRHDVDPSVFSDMMRWKGASSASVSEFVDQCVLAWDLHGVFPVIEHVDVDTNFYTDD